ncbi:MAG TPA: hypothetical protein VGU63_01855 [Candidatus Acidoferrales bacterium]|nr:hypothetical protein [Candidatus Acidoferrales bacterium]
MARPARMRPSASNIIPLLFTDPLRFDVSATGGCVIIVQFQWGIRLVSTDPTVGQQVKSGFRRAGAWLLGMAWFGLVIWGMENAFGTEANFSEGRHPSRVLGYCILATAAAIFIVTANRWKRVFPGIMLAATLGALLELEHGHIVNNSSVLIPRSIAFIQLIVIAGVTALSFTFKNRSLNIADRIALLIFAGSIYVGGNEVIEHRVPFALIVGGVCVFVAWTIDRLRRSHPRSALPTR